MTATGDHLDWIDRLTGVLEPTLRELRDAPAGAQDAHGRPGSHLLLTDEQWEMYDQATAMGDRQAERYGMTAKDAAVIGGGPGWGRGRRIIG